jgi:hypothetical protein
MKVLARALVVTGLCLLFLPLLSGTASAKPEYAKKEGKPCSFCHVGKPSDMKFTAAGEYYAANHTLKGFGEKGAETSPPAGKPEGEKPAGAGADNQAVHPGKGGVAEKMKAHLDEQRKAIAALRESERKLETLIDPAEFRSGVIDHLKILDGLQESQLRRMEGMMDVMREKMSMEGGETMRGDEGGKRYSYE